MSAAWHWLLQQGLLRDVVSWVTGLALGTLWAHRKFVKRLDLIADRLNDQTPGGIAALKPGAVGDPMPQDPGADPPSHARGRR